MRRLTRRQRTSAIVLTIVALVFVTLDLGGRGLSNAHSGVRGTLGALYRGTDSVLGPVRRWFEGLPGAGTHQSRIDDLEHQNALLQRQVDGLRADRATTGRLAALQRSADGSGDDLLPARVVAYGPGGGFDWTVTLDVGTGDGVQAGQTVTDGVGLVGRVLHADDSSSTVLLAADPRFGVGTRDVRSGEIGVATGDGASGFTFAPLSPTASVKVGDRLVTGPNGASTFVAGVDVGTVTSVRTSADGTISAGVRPTADPTSLDLVAVIVKPATVNAAGGH